MSLLTDNGISMASDSNKTYKKSFRVIENDPYKKTNYFENIDIGVSVWGELSINSIDFWTWFDKQIENFFNDYDSIPQFAKFLEEVLNETITEENKILKEKKELGVHLAFFLKETKDYRPGIYHITNKRKSGKITEFIGQADKVPLPKKGLFYLINGGYEPFSKAYYEYIFFSQKIRKFVNKKVKFNKNLLNKELELRQNLLTKECESLIASIRLYQAFLEMAKIKRLIGGPINAICFTEKGLVRRYNEISFGI